jgi:hypothetical protein
MNAQEPVEKATQIRSSSTAAEKESYIRSAVEGSPHKMVIIVVKEPGKDDHLTVAWIDDNNNLVFAKKVQNVTYTKHPENSGGKEFGNPELTSETLQGLASNNKTVEVIPLDFTAKYGPQAAAAKAAVFKAVLEKELTGDNASNRAQDAVDKAIESVDSSYGVSLKTVLQGLWDHFNQLYPNGAEFFAKLFFKYAFGLDVDEAAKLMAEMLKGDGPDVILPKTFVVGALQKAWEEYREHFEESAELIAEGLLEPRGIEKPMFGGWAAGVNGAIPVIVDKITPTTSWAKDTKQVAPPSAQEKIDGDESTGRHGDLSDGLMGRHRDAAEDYMDMIKAAVDASPTKVAIIGVTRDAGASKIDFLNADKFDHVLVAYYDHDKKAYVIAEMTPSPNAPNLFFGSQNSPGTLEKLVKDHHRYVAVPLKLTPEQDAQFRASLLKNQDGKYSFSTDQGYTCASLVMKALIDAKVWDWKETGNAFVAKLMEVLAKVGINVVLPGTLIAWAAAKGGTVYDSKTYSPATADKGGAADKPVTPAKADAMDKPVTSAKADATDKVPLAALGAASMLKASPPVDSDKTEPNADVTADGETDGDKAGSLQPKVGWVENPSSPKTVLPETSATLETLAAAPKNEDARTDDAAQQAETGDDVEDSQEEVALAPDDEDALIDDDDAQQPATEDDEEASQEEVALASDDDDARGDDDAAQRPATDDNEDASAEQVAIASDSEDAPTDDAAVVEVANAQAATDPDDGFSFSAFPKPATPADVVKEAMPAEQVSHEDSSGTPESETAHPDVGSEDVGNAAPSKEPVVHHSDLAP